MVLGFNRLYRCHLLPKAEKIQTTFILTPGLHFRLGSSASFSNFFVLKGYTRIGLRITGRKIDHRFIAVHSWGGLDKGHQIDIAFGRIAEGILIPVAINNTDQRYTQRTAITVNEYNDIVLNAFILSALHADGNGIESRIKVGNIKWLENISFVDWDSAAIPVNKITGLYSGIFIAIGGKTEMDIGTIHRLLSVRSQAFTDDQTEITAASGSAVHGNGGQKMEIAVEVG
jgi:hypothetical protein